MELQAEGDLLYTFLRLLFCHVISPHLSSGYIIVSFRFALQSIGPGDFTFNHTDSTGQLMLNGVNSIVGRTIVIPGNKSNKFVARII